MDKREKYTAMLLFLGTREQALEEEQCIIDACESDEECDEELQTQPATLETQSITLDTQPVPMETQPVTVNIQPTTLESQPATLEAQPVTMETQPATKETQPATKETQPATKETQPATKETQPATKETQPATKETQPATKETQPATKETQPATKETQPATKETQPATKETRPVATANKKRRRKQVKATVDKGTKKLHCSDLKKVSKQNAKEDKSTGKKSSKAKDCSFSFELGSPAHSDDEDKIGGTDDSVLTEIKELRKDLKGFLKSMLDKVPPHPGYHGHQEYSAYPSPSTYVPLRCHHTPLQPPLSVSKGYAYQQSLPYSPNFYNQNYISPSENNNHSLVTQSLASYEEEEVPPLPSPIVFPSEDSFEVDESFQDEEDSENISQDLANDREGLSSVGIASRIPLRQCNGSDTNNSRSPKEPDQIHPVTEVFNTTFLGKVRARSSSRSNFTTLLVRSFFKPFIRMSSNVSGTRGKKQLDKEIMAAIKVATFKMWPCTGSENELTAWQQCVRAVDSSGRQLYRPKRSKV